jgi:hypothetical protein
MAVAPQPRLSIGMPVYNGERFLDETLESILAQSFDDFELLISDDGSTDGSYELCQRYAQSDSRIMVSRSDASRGPAHNFNRVFRLSGGELFKWCAADDVMDTRFVEACVSELDRNPDAVLAYPRARTLSALGTMSDVWGGHRGLTSASTSARWRAAMAPPRNPMPVEVFGVVRRNSLAQTSLFGGFPDCDRFLIAELSLLGRFAVIEDPLLVHREHRARAGLQLTAESITAPMVCLGTEGASMRFPHWRLGRSCVLAAARAPTGASERMLCLLTTAQWAARNRRRLQYDISRNGERLPVVGSRMGRIHDRLAANRWARRTRRAAGLIATKVPRCELIVLVDDDSLDRKAFSALEIVGLSSGEGSPPDGPSAVAELKQAMHAGARYLAFCWPSFWWLDYYQELATYLELHARVVTRDKNHILYAL